MQKLKALVLSSLIILSVGCSATKWLPQKSVQTQTQWKTYDEIESVVKNIKRGDTLEQVKELGLDVHKTPNMESLTYLDIAKRFGLIGLKDKSVTVPDGVKKLMDADSLVNPHLARLIFL